MSDRRTLFLRFLGIGGAALFGFFFFFLTFHAPRWIEDFGRDYIEGEVLEHVDMAIDSIQEPRGDDVISRYAAQLMQENQAEIDRLRESLKSGARARLSDCIAAMLELPDEQREKLRALLEDGARWRISALQDMSAQLLGLMQQGYLKVVGELRRDVRIFAASNATAFLLLVMISFLKPEHTRALFVPGILLATSTLLCTYLYVFEQNWLLTIIHSSYLGFAYTAWLGVVFLLLCDVWLNRARVTTHILDLAGQALQGITSILTPG